MTKIQKEKIEDILYNFPALNSRLNDLIIKLGQVDYHIKAITYDGIKTGKTNNIASEVESYVINKWDCPELVELRKRRDKTVNILVGCLTKVEYNFVVDRYFDMLKFPEIIEKRKNEWEIYSTVTLSRWRNKILEKLFKGGILDGV